jgi:hypothetical protein
MLQTPTDWFQGLRPWRVQGRALALLPFPGFSGPETDMRSLWYMPLPAKPNKAIGAVYVLSLGEPRLSNAGIRRGRWSANPRPATTDYASVSWLSGRASEKLKPTWWDCHIRFSVTPGGIDRFGMKSRNLACPALYAASMLLN